MSLTINIDAILGIAHQAGQAILAIYDQPFEVEKKSDSSPLTAADLAANQIIVDQLKALYPKIPIISEENKLLPYSERKNWNYCWSVDPLDGTKEFVKRNGEFTVNIALIHEGLPILGVIYVPVKDTFYYAEKGKGCFKKVGMAAAQSIEVAPIHPKKTVHIFASRSHRNQATEDYLQAQQEKYADVKTVGVGSSLKFCLIAEGTAHIYPRFAPTMEWDTAAGQIIAQEAGATIRVYPSGEILRYNRENLLNPYFLVMSYELKTANGRRKTKDGRCA